MNISIIFGRIIGLFLFLSSFCLLINKEAFNSFIRLSRSKVFTLFIGFAFSLFGIIIVTLHNIWEFSWVVLITVSGWLFIVEGLFRILFLDLIVKLLKNKDSYLAMKFSLFFTLIIGVYLIFVTF
jgi:hypothetical protein